MSSASVRAFEPGDRNAVIELWERCDLTRSWNDPSLDVERKLRRDPGGFLVGVVDSAVVASVMVGYDGHRGWVNYLAVDPGVQGSGWGRRMMDAAEAHLRALGCPKVNLQIRTSNLDATRFYEALGYTPDDVVSYGKRLIADE